MKTWEIDPTSDADVADWHAVAAASAAHLDPDLPLTPLEFDAAMVRENHRLWPRRHFLAGDGRPVASATLMFWHPTDANAYRIEVEPEYDPAISDDECLDAVRSLLRQAGQIGVEQGHRLLSMDAPQEWANARALEALGCKLVESDHRNCLEVADLDRAQLEAWASAVPEGYELISWSGRCPDDLVDGYVHIFKAMNDAPIGDMDFQDIEPSEALMREFERVNGARGNVKLTVAALVAGTREVAAFTELIVAPVRPWLVDQEDTAVDPPHRGHGLGLVVKAANLLRLLDAYPEAKRVQTWNSTSNQYMLKVNDQLGFQRNWLWAQWEMAAAEAAAL